MTMVQRKESITSFPPEDNDAGQIWRKCFELWNQLEPDWERLLEALESESSETTTTLYDGSLSPSCETFKLSDDELRATLHFEVEALTTPREDFVSSLTKINECFVDLIQATDPLPYRDACRCLTALLDGHTNLPFLEQGKVINTLHLVSWIPEKAIKDANLLDYCLASEARAAVTRNALERMTCEGPIGEAEELNRKAEEALECAIGKLNIPKYFDFETARDVNDVDQVMSASEADQPPPASIEQPPEATYDWSPFSPLESVVATQKASGRARLNGRVCKAVPLDRTQSLPAFPSSPACPSSRQPFRAYPRGNNLESLREEE